MYLLDNDSFNLYIVGDKNIVERLKQDVGQTWLSSVAAEELLTGRMSGLNRARSPRNSLSLARAHEDFAQALEDLGVFPLLVYSTRAEAVFKAFPSAIQRIGAQDCRIAAQAIAHDMTVVTRNLRDFQAIGVRCEDWSAVVPQPADNIENQ